MVLALPPGENWLRNCCGVGASGFVVDIHAVPLGFNVLDFNDEQTR